MISDTSINTAPATKRNDEQFRSRERGKRYLETVAVKETRLQDDRELLLISNKVKRAIQTITRQVLQHPSLQDEFVEIFNKQQKLKQRVVDNEEKNISDPELQEDVVEFKKEQSIVKDVIKDFPITEDLRVLFKDDQESFSKIIDSLSDILVKFVKANVLSSSINLEQGGQVSYSFDDFLAKSVDLILTEIQREREKKGEYYRLEDSEKTIDSLEIIKEAITLEAQLEVSFLDPETKKLSLLRWVTETIQAVNRDGLRVFNTPHYQDLFNHLESIADQRNGLAGALLFGPPGTGKTEILIEANKRLGFDTRVVSVHHFSDFVQFIGEKPIPIGMDRKTSHIQRLQMMKETLEGLSGKSAIDFCKTQINRFQVDHVHAEEKDFVAFMVPDLVDKITTLRTEEGANAFVDALQNRLTNDIITIGLGVQQGLTEEVAWVYGEILQGFKDHKRIVLDEMDKASDHSLDGISRLLNLSPGGTISLGTETFDLPSWARIDGTANAMNVQPYLHDRFYPNIILVDYPPAHDLMQMSLVWLSDEQGNIKITENEQVSVVGILKYVFPEIQKLYPDKIAYPLSLRGIRKFCQMISTGKEIPEAINMLLLEEGALAKNPQQQEEIRKVIERFGYLLSPEITVESETTKKSRMESLFSSPLFSSASENFSVSDHKIRQPEKVELSLEEINQLAKEKDKNSSEEKGLFLSRGQEEVSIEQNKANTKDVVVRVAGKVVRRVSVTAEAIQDNMVITGNDSEFNKVLLTAPNSCILLDVKSGENKSWKWEGNRKISLTPDGKYLISYTQNEISLTPTETFLRVGKVENIHIFDGRTGNKMKVTNFDVSSSGSTMIIETSSHETFLIDLFAVNSLNISLSTPFSQDRGWQISNSILFNQQKQEAFMVR